MAEKSITIILRARNAMAAGLGKAARALKAFGSSALRIGSFFAKGFLAAGVAVAGFATKAIAAYAVQETAERSLIAAMNAQGEAGDELVPVLKKIASAIQDETGAADESTLAGMAKMRMLGVQTSKLGEAAKGVLALKSVGLEEEAAQKAVAMAMQGSYDMLNRYLPALRMTKDETEKARIVNDFFAKGYDQQAAVLNTVGGQWNLLKGRIGDVWEEIGAAIMQNEGLMVSLTRAGEAVKEFGAKISAWVEGGGVVNLIATFKLFYNDVSHTFKLIGNTASVTWAAIGDGADTVVANIVSGFKYAGDFVAALWKQIKNPFSFVKAPNKNDYGFGIVTTQTVKALAARTKLNEDYAKRIDEIAAEQTKNLIKKQDEVFKKKKILAEAEKKMAESATKVVEKETAKQKKAKLDALKEELSAIKKLQGIVEGMAKSRVQSVIEQRRAEKEEAKSVAKDEAKAKMLAEREDRGVKLSRKDKEFLEAAREIETAKRNMAELNIAEIGAAGKIGAAESLAVQKDIKGTLETIKQQNEKLLTYSGG